MSSLVRLLLEDRPASIVLIGGAELDEVAMSLGKQGCETHRYATLSDCLAAARDGSADNALLALPSDSAVRAAREHLIGAACRAFPGRLLLYVPSHLSVPASELFAFGFRQLHQSTTSSVHEYRLKDYKQPPDWLNARFWANPERFALDPDDDDSGFDETGFDDEE